MELLRVTALRDWRVNYKLGWSGRMELLRITAFRDWRVNYNLGWSGRMHPAITDCRMN
jgi:hypothetical protein